MGAKESRSYANYQLVRAEVLRMVDAPARDFERMLDASPSVIENLRRHCHDPSGAHPDDYAPGRDDDRLRFETKLRMLTELEGDALLVPEARALGGFGYEIDGALYNTDTLKFFEALIALERGAVLDEIRAPGRRLVWEIGAGWGGLAYQFKTLLPDVTYVIVDRPERFLFSATYLMSLLPDAKVHFWTDEDAAAEWDDIDFAFVPPHARDSLSGHSPDLALSLLSFEEMPAEQVDGCARRAWELGCPFIYSFNRDDVREVLGRYYWLHEVPLLELQTHPLRERLVRWGRSALAGDSSFDYRHAVGWRRAST